MRKPLITYAQAESCVMHAAAIGLAICGVWMLVGCGGGGEDEPTACQPTVGTPGKETIPAVPCRANSI